MLLTEALELLEKNGYEISDNATEKQRERLAKDIREQIVPVMMEIIFKRSFGEEEFKHKIMECYLPIAKIMADKNLTKEQKAEAILDNWI